LKNVVLPAPLGPITLTIDFGLHREVEVADRDKTAELLGYALGLQQRHG
jgi:hypothetical protein